MCQQTNDFLADWKEIADIDDSLAEQVDKAVRRIREGFERKQEAYASPKKVIDFRLGVVVRKKMAIDADGRTKPSVFVKLGLLSSSGLMDMKNYVEAATLLRETVLDAACMRPALDKVNLQFQRVKISADSVYSKQITF